MADYGAKFADKKIRKVDRQLQAVYRQAEKELLEQLAEFVRKSKAKNEYKQKQLAAGLITEAEYQSWLKGQVFQKERWERKIKSVQKVMHDHNVTAAKIVHENKLDVYTENYLHNAFEMQGISGISFELYNEQAVASLIRDRDQILPEWKIDEKKDYAWNYRKINNAVLQGIIQGQSIDKITKRLAQDLSSQNESKMRMFARTAINQAHNMGKQQQMEDAAKMGIEQLKQWVATLDSRTRDTHRHLDGQEVPYDKPFKSDLGDIMFPSDPTADPANVYNCRCTMITIYPKYRTEQDNWRENETIDGQTYAEWKEGKKKKIQQSEEKAKTTYGIMEKTSEYNEKVYKVNDKIKHLEEEYSDLYTQSNLKLIEGNLEEYNTIEERMTRINEEIASLREKNINTQADRSRYLSEAGEKEIRERFGEIKGKHNAALDAKSVNTMTADPRTQNNCAACALAFDVRRRGIDCRARRSFGTNNIEVETWWQGLKIESSSRYWATDAREEIRGIANQWGEGARGIVQVDWNKYGGHTFAFEVTNGRCTFFDPQTGIMNADDIFDTAVPGSVRYARTDDKVLARAAVFGLEESDK